MPVDVRLKGPLAKRRNFVISLVVAISVGFGTLYFLLWPLLYPRGVFGWGHFRLVDLALGLSFAAVLMFALVFSAADIRQRRMLVFRMILVVSGTLIPVAVFDVFYSVCVGGLLVPHRTDSWFDDSGAISRQTNEPDDELGFVRKPGLKWSGGATPDAEVLEYRTDENGFRNAANIKRADVVFIGDSFTEGASVQENATFTNSVERQTGLVCINLGRGHYGPQQEAIVLHRYGFSYSPETVVWQLFEGNDLGDAERFAAWRDGSTKSESMRLRYVKRSPIFQLINLTARSRDEESPYRMLELIDQTLQPVHLDYKYTPDAPRQSTRGVAEFKQAAGQIAALCNERNAKLLAVFVPIKVKVLAPWIQFDDEDDRERWLPTVRDRVSGDFGEVCAQCCEELGIDFIDASASLQNAAESNRREIYHLGQDSHLAQGGHQVVANLVTQWIQKQTQEN